MSLINVKPDKLSIAILESETIVNSIQESKSTFINPLIIAKSLVMLSSRILVKRIKEK